MIKRIAAISLIVFGLSLMWALTSTVAMDHISQERKGDKWWSANNWKNGNLVGMAYLNLVKKFNPAQCNTEPRAERMPQANNTVLYLYGDSYSWPLRDTNFEAVSAYHFTNRYQGGCYGLDKNKKNILVIEIAERLVLDYFSNENMSNEFHDSTDAKNATVAPAGQPGHFSMSDLSLDYFFNKRINQNLEYNLFNYNFIAFIFEAKAFINYYIFKRASGNVTFSKDLNYLFDKGSVDINDMGSSYAAIPADKISVLVENINGIYTHFKACGFYEVYLSIIPSTPSIVQPDGYNNLIPLIQNNNRLQMKVIDIYDVYKDMREDYFCHGDTHWSPIGERRWLELVNKTLYEIK